MTQGTCPPGGKPSPRSEHSDTGSNTLRIENDALRKANQELTSVVQGIYHDLQTAQQQAAIWDKKMDRRNFLRWTGRAGIAAGFGSLMYGALKNEGLIDMLNRDAVDVLETLTNRLNSDVVSAAEDAEKSYHALRERPELYQTGLIGEQGVLDADYMKKLDAVFEAAKNIDMNSTYLDMLGDMVTKLQARHAQALLKLEGYDKGMERYTDKSSRGFINLFRKPFERVMFGDAETTAKKREVSRNNLRYYMQDILTYYELQRTGKITEAKMLNDIKETLNSVDYLESDELKVIEGIRARANAGQMENMRDYIMKYDPAMLDVEQSIIYRETVLPWMKDTAEKLTALKVTIDDVQDLQRKRQKQEEINEEVRGATSLSKSAAKTYEEQENEMQRLTKKLYEFNQEMTQTTKKLKEKYGVDDRYQFEVMGKGLPIKEAMQVMTAATIVALYAGTEYAFENGLKLKDRGYKLFGGKDPLQRKAEGLQNGVDKITNAVAPYAQADTDDATKK